MRKQNEHPDHGAQERDELSSLEWVRELESQPAMEQVLTAGALLSKTSVLPDDHIFSALLDAGLLRDMLSLYDGNAQRYHAIVALGDSVCGHRGIVHGGLSAMIVDEALGALVYLLKREQVLGPGPAFTAHLGVDYKKPLPAGSTVVCTTSLESVDGRKGWVTAELRDRPGGELFASARALYVVAKKPMPQLNGEFKLPAKPVTA